jgi:hypothetical protein
MRLILKTQLPFKNIVFSVVTMLVAVSSNAQILQPVKWTIESKKLNDKEFEIVCTAKIDKGWHLYSQFAEPDGPTPTSFNLEASTKFTPIGKVTEEKGHVVYEELFKMEVKYFEDKAVFVQKIKKVTTEKVTVVGEIDFMSCNDRSCVPAYFDIEVELL